MNTTPKTSSDLFNGLNSDKHFLLGQRVDVDKTAKTVRIYVDSAQAPVRLNDKIEGDGPTIQEISGNVSVKADGSYSKMLLSGGAIIGLGKTWSNAKIILLQKDAGAPTDPGRLTMPAGRMDRGLAAHCYDEMFETIIWGQDEQGKVIYCPNVQDVERKSDLAVECAKKAGVIPQDGDCRVQMASPVNQKVPGGYTINLFVDDEQVETMSDAMVVIDEANNTLEFRQLVLIDLPVDKGNHVVAGVADGDGFGRVAFIVPAQNLVNYITTIQQASAQELQDMMLCSQVPGLDVTVSTEPTHGGKFGKFFWDTKGLVLPLTTTLTAVANVLK